MATNDEEPMEEPSWRALFWMLVKAKPIETALVLCFPAMLVYVSIKAYLQDGVYPTFFLGVIFGPLGFLGVALLINLIRKAGDEFKR